MMNDMSPGSSGGWWGRRPRHARWVYALLVGAVLGASLASLEAVPVSHVAHASYVILVSQPSNASSPSCQGAVFDQTGTYSFAWTPPSGIPLTLTVQGAGGGPYLYNGTTLSQAQGSIHVDGPATY
ncbi:MAG: hypothetical protein L3K17_06955 [Thermoplasmata archaeon]|nr:hypothetical protein [Thermoplasmata archaeon]